MTPDETNILIVDDEVGMRTVLERYTSELGYQAGVASSGAEALEHLKSEAPVDILLSDIMMPELDGIELLKHAKAMDEDIEVVLFTGYASLETALEAIRHGAFDFILKPFRLEQLKLVLERAGERRRLLEVQATLKAELVNSKEALRSSEASKDRLAAETAHLKAQLQATQSPDPGVLAAMRAGPPIWMGGRQPRTEAQQLASELEKLEALKQRGTITDSEFFEGKRLLIKGA